MALTAHNLPQAFAAGALGPLNTIQAFRPHAGVNPILLSTTTCLIHMAPVAGLAPYSVSKGAGVKLLDHFAAENPELHLVHVQPGWVATDMNGNQPEAPDVGMYPSSAAMLSPSLTSASRAARSVLCLAGLARSLVPQRPLCLG